MMSLARCY